MKWFIIISLLRVALIMGFILVAYWLAMLPPGAFL